MLKYNLRKGSAKDKCPGCGHKTFTPYVDSAGVPLDPHVGRCDRQNKCAYHYSPADLFRDNPQLRRQTQKYYQINPPTHIQPKAQLPVGFIPQDTVNASINHYEKNPLAQFLHHKFDLLIGPDCVNTILNMYGVGTSKAFGGSTVFWLIDDMNRVRDGKIMGYDATTGKRIKKPFSQITTVHSRLKIDDREWKPCMFGSHLVAANPDKEVWIFESEKAALICALALERSAPGDEWPAIPIASSGCSALNPRPENLHDPMGKYAMLEGCDIVLFPDEGMYHPWSKTLGMFNRLCRRTRISTIAKRYKDPQDKRLACEINEGEALDDFILRYIDRGLDLRRLMQECRKGDVEMFTELYCNRS